MAANNRSNDKQRSTLSSDKPIFSWEGPEFIKYKKTFAWFISIFAAALILGFIFARQQQWSSVALVACAFIVFTSLSNAKPKKISCALYQDGIVIDEKVFSFNQFKSFWLASGELPKIKLQLLGHFSGQVTMPLVGIDPNQVRLYLAKHLPEENKGPDVIDEINRILRF